MIPLPFPQRRGVSYLIRNTSDGDSNGTTYNWYGWNGSTFITDDYPWLAAVSAWVEWRQVETSLGVFNGWGLQHQADPTLGKLHYLYEKAYANGSMVLLRIPTGHWSPDFIIGTTAGLVPDCGITVAGDGVTPYRMPFVVHPNYRTHLLRLWNAARSFLNTLLPDGSTYADHTIGMPLDAASDAGSEWSTSVVTKLANDVQMNTMVDSYGPLVLDAAGDQFAQYPRSLDDTYSRWKADAWAAQWLWGLHQFTTLFSDVPILVALGQIFGDGDSHARAWCSESSINAFGGANAGRVLAMRTNWHVTGTDNVPASWIGYGLDPAFPLVVIDRSMLNDVRVAGGRFVLQSASTSLFPAPLYSSGGSIEWGVENDLNPYWLDVMVFEASPTQIDAHTFTRSALQAFQGYQLLQLDKRVVLRQADGGIRVLSGVS